MRISLLRQKEASVMYPKGWGLVYVDYVTFTAICAPIPLNLLFRWLRTWWNWVFYFSHPNKWDKKIDQAIAEVSNKLSKEIDERLKVCEQVGYRRGEERGYLEGYKQRQRELEQIYEDWEAERSLRRESYGK